MAPPRPSFLAPALLLLAIFLHAAHASLMGVDLGLAYVKVSMARPSKGLELVTNEQAKRKTPAAVGFTTDGERLFGDAAVAYSGKAPSRVVLDGRNLIGACKSAGDDGGLRCQPKVVSVDGAGEFSGEHVVAMHLAMARRQASAALDGAVVKDVVVSVPAWFDHHDRQSVVDSARVIGLNCLAVVNANTAAAVKYAIDGKAKPTADAAKKRGTGKAARTQTVMFYDLGAGGATASIAEIVTDAKTGAATSVKMLGHEWEKGVGGRAFDQVIMGQLADDFDKQRGAGATPTRELPRVMMRLRKEAQRVREILSANTETMVAVPSLHDDVDFRSTATRESFEKGAKASFEQAVKPAKRVLAATGLSVDDLDAVVPFGGASRTPRVQELLIADLGISALNKSINSDEAAVYGNAFIAASLSSTFRVRNMDIEDVYGRGVSAEVGRDAKSAGMFSSGGDKAEPQKVVIFKADGSKMPAKKTLSFKREDDFSVDIFVDESKAGVGRYPERTLYSRAKISGAAKVLKKLKDPANKKGLTPQISLTVSMDRSGFVKITSAESAVEEVTEVEREVPVKETGKDKAKDKAKSESADDAEQKDEKAKEEGEKEKTEEKPKMKIEKSKQTLVHRQTLTVTYENVPNSLEGSHMSAEDVSSTTKMLKELEVADIERQERADALNELEGFILELRSAVRSADDDEPLGLVTTEEERSSFVTKLEEAEDWMYTDEAKKTKNLKAKLADLKKIYKDMKFRADQLEKRPAALSALDEVMASASPVVESLRKLHESVGTKEMSKFDEFDSLLADTNKWLTDKKAAQEALALVDPPAFTSDDLSKKGMFISLKLRAITSMKYPTPPEASVAPPSKDDDPANETVTVEDKESSDVPEVDPPIVDPAADGEVNSGSHDEL